jgi:hypothetical protein
MPDEDEVCGGDIYGPFRTREAAQVFAEKVDARVDSNYIRVSIAPIRRPLIRNVRDSGVMDLSDDGHR